MQKTSYNRNCMNKTKAIVKFCVIGVMVVLGLLLCFVEFTLPFTNIKYEGFYNAIQSKMGIDLNGGVLAVFDVVEDENTVDLDKEIDATINRIEDMLVSEGYLEATVTRQGNKIRIEVPGMENTEDVMSAIGTPANIEFMTPTDSQSDVYNENEIFLSGDDIEGVTVVSDPDDATLYAIQLTFTDEGAKKFRDEVQSAGGKYMTIFSNEEMVSSPQIDSESAATLGSDGTVLITGGYTREGADAFALQIESGLYTVGLAESEMSYIPATLGEGAVFAGVLSLIIGILIILFIMWLFYKDLGILAGLSLLIYTIIFLFFLAVIDAIQLTLPGIAGIILSIGMAVDANVLIFEQIKEEYRKGKRFGAAVHSGFNKSIRAILDANITTILVSIILYLLSDGTIKGFAITLGLGVAISIFAGLVITRGLAKLYLYINPDNAKRANFAKIEREKDTIEPDHKPVKRKLNLGGVK